ncbi:hypothetical protein CRE_16543 [Caenorhabditis remanei]|uniref:Glycosyltransferase family 92 protein n=1 Tax=Caenorhabditis remanei TaxID=31234 RepID=E3NRM7_CAERE|nr:hypothetical protein CRE_16543 [Caenorhabditis remanei]
MTCYRNGAKCVLFMLFMGLAVLNMYSYGKDSHSFNYRTTSMQPEVIVEQRLRNKNQFPVLLLHSIVRLNPGIKYILMLSQMRIFIWNGSKIISHDETIFWNHKFDYCLLSSIRIIFQLQLIHRGVMAPIHEVSVCVGPIYGSESNWLEVAEFIEHYKLIGVRYFYFTVFNMNEYSRKIIDEYLRTGEIELTVIQSEYETIDWQFHLLQINECHQRSKHHSKWVINVDIDERLVILDDKIKSVGSLLSGYNDTVAEVGFAIRRIQKTEKLPEKYESDEQVGCKKTSLRNDVTTIVYLFQKDEKQLIFYNYLEKKIVFEMEFLKYSVSSPVTWGAYKTIYRPEKVQVSEDNSNRINNQHYRTSEKNILGSGWLTDPNYKNFTIVPEETKFAEKLKENVLKKIKYVYDQRVLYCEEIAEIPYEEYKEFGHDIFNCTFRNETGSNKSVD